MPTVRNQLLAIASLAALTLSSCASGKHLPEADKVWQSPFGAVVRVTLNLPSQREDGRRHVRYTIVTGELLAVSETGFYLSNYGETDTAVFVRPKWVTEYNIQDARSHSYGHALTLTSLTTISHGFYAVITLPVNVIAGLIIGMGSANSYQVRTDEIPMNQLRIYARYPQGLPEGVELVLVDLPDG